METKIQELSFSLFVQEIIIVVVSMIVVFIIAKLCYDRYKSRLYNEADSKIQHTLKH